MREELKPMEDVRSTFTGVFVRLGTKNSFGHPQQTVLFKDVQDASGKIVADHLWFNLTQGFLALELSTGDRVRFDARVRPYTKGYRGRREDVYDSPLELDYKLSHPTRLEKL